MGSKKLLMNILDKILLITELLNPNSKDRCLEKLSEFRKVRNKFQRALHQAQKKAKDNPKLWFYDEEISAPIQGLELEKSNDNLLKLWERGFWRRPDIRKKKIQKKAKDNPELHIGCKSQDIATKKDWEAAKKNLRLRNREKGPPKKGWIWERHERHIRFWRKKLPFNPDVYLQRFQSELMVPDRNRRKKPEEPLDSETRLLCEYALFESLHDYLKDLGTSECDYLTDIEKDDWAKRLCLDVEAFLSIEKLKTPWVGEEFYENLEYRLLQIDLALDHVKTDLAAPQVNNDMSQQLDELKDELKTGFGRVEAAVSKGNIKKQRGKPGMSDIEVTIRTEIVNRWVKAKAAGVSKSEFLDDLNEKGIDIDGKNCRRTIDKAEFKKYYDSIKKRCERTSKKQ